MTDKGDLLADLEYIFSLVYKTKNLLRLQRKMVHLFGVCHVTPLFLQKPRKDKLNTEESSERRFSNSLGRGR